jgi:hypothetical protein
MTGGRVVTTQSGNRKLGPETVRWVRALSKAAGVGVATASLLFTVVALLRLHTRWPTANSDNLVLLAIFGIAALPLLIVLLAVVIAQRGRFKVQWVELDLGGSRGRAVLSVEAPPNIGAGTQPIGDSGSVSILSGLERATTHPAAVIDLGPGDAWWETRLFILAAGAERLGRPQVLVFVSESSAKGTFVGWAKPAALTAALMRVGRPRSDIYRASHGLATIAADVWRRALTALPPQGPTPPPPPEVVNLGHPWNAPLIAMANGALNPFSNEQFLGSDLGMKLENPWLASAEAGTPPTSKVVTVTPDYLRELLGAELNTLSLTSNSESETLLAAYADSTAEWFAFTKADAFERLVSREVLQDSVVRAIVRTYREEAAS